MRVLVTGAAGFIGAHVVAALARSGAQVRAFDRDLDGAPLDGAAEPVAGDILDQAALERALRGCDAAIHLAALYSYARGDAAAMQRVNVDGTRALLAAAARAGVGRVVVTSSAGTCGPVPGRPAHEGDAPPAWELAVPYKRTKTDGERVALAAAVAGQDVVVVNPTTPVGPGDRRPTPTGQMVADVAGGRIRAYVPGTALNVVAVEDVAAGHLLALERGRAGERYLLGGENLPLGEVFAIVARRAGLAAPRLRVPYAAALGAAHVADRVARLRGREPRLLNLDEVRLARLPMTFSSAKAERELGYAWRPAAEALTAAAAWFQSPQA